MTTDALPPPSETPTTERLCRCPRCELEFRLPPDAEVAALEHLANNGDDLAEKDGWQPTVWLLIGGLNGEGMCARAAFATEADALAARDACIAHDKTYPVVPPRDDEEAWDAFNDEVDAWQQGHPLATPNIVLDNWAVESFAIRGPLPSPPEAP